MMEEIGTVRSVDGVMATVMVPRKSACQGCTAGACKPDEQAMEIEAINEAHAQPGQRVRVVIRSLTFLRGSMMVYGIPAVGLVVGAVIGRDLLSGFFKGADPDILSAVSGFAFFCLSFVIVKIWANAAGKRTESKPVVEEILD